MLNNNRRTGPHQSVGMIHDQTKAERQLGGPSGRNGGVWRAQSCVPRGSVTSLPSSLGTSHRHTARLRRRNRSSRSATTSTPRASDSCSRRPARRWPLRAARTARARARGAAARAGGGCHPPARRGRRAALARLRELPPHAGARGAGRLEPFPRAGGAPARHETGARGRGGPRACAAWGLVTNPCPLKPYVCVCPRACGVCVWVVGGRPGQGGG